MFNAWGQKTRDAGKINDVVDQLFCTRFLDKGTCGGCDKELMGIYGTNGHEQFYCRKCWNAYLKSGASDAEWEEWATCAPVPRKCVTDRVAHHELKCVLLALSRVGGTITFPPSLSSYDRMKVHTFCEEEPELTSLHTTSYGEGNERVLTVSSVNKERRIAEARALLQAEAPDGSAEAQRPDKRTPDDSVTSISQTLEQLTLDVPRAVHAVSTQKSEQPTSKKSDAKAAPPPPLAPPQQPGPPQGKTQAAPPPPPSPPQELGAPQGKGASAKSPVLAAKGEGPTAERPNVVQSTVDESAFPALGSAAVDEGAFPALGSMAGSVKKGKKGKK